MRLKKNPGLINMDVNTDRLVPFRTILLDANELAAVESVATEEASEKSEEILKEIMKKRGMDSLLYSDKKNEQWSGYVMVKGLELWLI